MILQVEKSEKKSSVRRRRGDPGTKTKKAKAQPTSMVIKILGKDKKCWVQPTLEDLERMFEESDSDSETPASAPAPTEGATAASS